MNASEKQPPTFINDLATILYTQENIARANAYALSRGVDPAKFVFPWVASGPDRTPFNWFRAFKPPGIFTDSLYIPIVEIDCETSAPVLAGFDVRYIGTQPHRLRWHKFKRTDQSILVYNVQAALNTERLVVTEAAIDAEVFRTIGYEAISPLTALSTPRFVHFLYALGADIFLAYDNDDDGRKATDKVLQYAARFPGAQKAIRPLIYPGKDPSKAIETWGHARFKQRIDVQIF